MKTRLLNDDHFVSRRRFSEFDQKSLGSIYDPLRKRCLASRNSASSSLLDRLTVDKRWQRKALVLGTFHAVLLLLVLISTRHLLFLSIQDQFDAIMFSPCLNFRPLFLQTLKHTTAFRCGYF